MRPVKLADVARELHQSPDPRQPIATQNRFEALLPHTDGYLRELLLLVNATGHRLSQVLSLKWSDIDFDAKPYGAICWRADAVGNKVRHEHVVQINPDVRALLEEIRRERPSVGAVWLFPGIRKPKYPTHRSVADKWLRQAERRAGLAPLQGSLWHAYRRKWATEKKHLPAADVAKAGGWKGTRTLPVYQHADSAGVLRVVLDETQLREERG